MTASQLTSLGTLASIIGATTIFILLAHWSAGGSWGISTAVARGLIGSAGRSGSIAGEWSGDDALEPIRPPEMERLWGTERGSVRPTAVEPTAELEELGARRLP